MACRSPIRCSMLHTCIADAGAEPHQWVGLRAVSAACQGMLQGGCQLVAVQRRHPVIVVACREYATSQGVKPLSLRQTFTSQRCKQPSNIQVGGHSETHLW